MNDSIYKAIRRILEENPKLTQRGLAEVMGLNPAAINRMLYGKRSIKADELPVIESYLGRKIDLSGKAESENKSAMMHALGQIALNRAEAGEFKIPVLDENENVVEQVLPHPLQPKNESAFALYIVTSEMEPRYFYGELIYAHKRKPPEAGKDCVVKMKDGKRYVARFSHLSDGYAYIEQLNPKREVKLTLDEIDYISAIVGRG